MTGPVDTSLRAVFAGRRGRLLVGLLFAEFGAAVQGVAYSTVLPIAARDLDGTALFGATLAAASLATILVLAAGPGAYAWLGARGTLAVATVVYVAGVVVAATAPTMVWVLVGSVLRGLAAGLLAGFGLTAIGGLYEDALRSRVLGLFAVVWLLPSLAGPAFNAVVTVAFGWRWAVAWPALVVLVARLLVGRDAGLIPWGRSAQRLGPTNGVLVIAGLVLASVASGGRTAYAVAGFVLGVALAVLGTVRLLRTLVGPDPARRRVVLVFLGLCLAFFGGDGLIVLAVVEGLGRGVVLASVALGAGLVAWSVTGLLPTRYDARLPDLIRTGLVLVAIGLAVLALAQALGGSVGAVLAVGGFALAGLGMGLGYQRLSAAAFDDLPSGLVASAATAVAFAETSGTAIGALVGGGSYSLGTSLGWAAPPTIGWPFALLALIALAAAAARHPRRRTTPATDPTGSFAG